MQPKPCLISSVRVMWRITAHRNLARTILCEAAGYSKPASISSFVKVSDPRNQRRSIWQMTRNLYFPVL